jgi:hypothetical protein
MAPLSSTSVAQGYVGPADEASKVTPLLDGPVERLMLLAAAYLHGEISNR